MPGRIPLHSPVVLVTRHVERRLLAAQSRISEPCLDVHLIMQGVEDQSRRRLDSDQQYPQWTSGPNACSKRVSRDDC